MSTDSISITIEERKVELTVIQPNFIQINLLEPVVLESVAENTAHREIVAGNPHGTSKGDVGLGDVTDDPQLKRAAGDFQAFPQKITPEVGDSIIIEDSSDVWNKKWVTIDGIKTIFRAAFDLVYQPLSTALSKITESGGLPLWDGGAWPGGGGGGGGAWENVSSYTIVGTETDIDFTDLTDGPYAIVYEDLSLEGQLYGLHSVDNGVTFSAIASEYFYHQNRTAPSAASYSAANNNGTLARYLLNHNITSAAGQKLNGHMFVYNGTGADDGVLLMDSQGVTKGAAPSNQKVMCKGPTGVNAIRLHTTSGTFLVGGKVHLLKFVGRAA